MICHADMPDSLVLLLAAACPAWMPYGAPVKLSEPAVARHNSMVHVTRRASAWPLTWCASSQGKTRGLRG